MEDKFLRVDGVMAMLGIKRSTVWLYVSQGKLPRPIKLSPRVSVWRLSDIMAYMEKATGGER